MNEVITSDLLKDNDPRMRDRVIMVVVIGNDHVVACDTSGRRVKISKKRIFLDGKTRRYGFNVLLDRRIK